LKDRSDNQRKPDTKHISDLRDALKTVIGKKIEKKVEPLGNLVPKSEPSPEELKKILNG
jgi:hypothetical protein